MWLQRLPPQAQLVLTVFEKDLTLATLAERADQVAETLTQTQIGAVSQTNSSNTSSTCGLEDQFTKMVSVILWRYEQRGIVT